jgi:hypothetical protein
MMAHESRRRWFQVSLGTVLLWFLILGLVLGWWIDRASRVTERMLPRGPNHDAIYERFGDPDRIRGSGFSFLDYDLKNGQTITLMVSSEINQVTVHRRK